MFLQKKFAFTLHGTKALLCCQEVSWRAAVRELPPSATHTWKEGKLEALQNSLLQTHRHQGSYPPCAAAVRHRCRRGRPGRPAGHGNKDIHHARSAVVQRRRPQPAAAHRLCWPGYTATTCLSTVTLARRQGKQASSAPHHGMYTTPLPCCTGSNRRRSQQQPLALAVPLGLGVQCAIRSRRPYLSAKRRGDIRLRPLTPGLRLAALWGGEGAGVRVA